MRNAREVTASRNGFCGLRISHGLRGHERSGTVTYIPITGLPAMECHRVNRWQCASRRRAITGAGAAFLAAILALFAQRGVSFFAMRPLRANAPRATNVNVVDILRGNKRFPSYGPANRLPRSRPRSSLMSVDPIHAGADAIAGFMGAIDAATANAATPVDAATSAAAATAAAASSSGGGSPPMLVTLLNDEQLRMLAEMADRGVAKRVLEVAGEVSKSISAALQRSPLAAGAWDSADDLLRGVEHCVTPGMATAERWLERMGLSHEQSQGAVAALAVLGAYAVLSAAAAQMTPEAADLPTDYDLGKLEAYYRKRPVLVARRFVEVVASLSTFGLSLLADILQGKWDVNMAVRARQLRELTSRNGPAFIKVGQGASIRPDIFPPIYIEEMQKLQDRVPAFPSHEARRILEERLGAKLETVFADIAAFDRPLAAASLGQVYRAKLKSTGEEVAVKVQRPDLLATVTLDLYVMRIILQLLSRFDAIGDGVRSVLGLIDSWAVRFLDELDYVKEAANAERFARNLGGEEAALGRAIVVPRVLHGMTSRFVLVTQWVEGVKVSTLDVNTPAGRAKLSVLQATLLNAYLTQLLESGFLHADPHPGNFLLTPDGRLCILDYGLMTEVTPDQRYALLEYVSHLIAKDYAATLDDLVVLGFIPPEVAADLDKVRLVVPLLAHILEQLSEGGGVATINIDTVGEELTDLAANYPIQIPPYFGLVIRAFGVIEGLGLSMDPGYSIVKECFPYLARRLLTEDTPRMRRMLKSFLYGRNGEYLQV
ncbi:unnamed protein product, partial [Phaeothamnion confervicola]